MFLFIENYPHKHTSTQTHTRKKDDEKKKITCAADSNEIKKTPPAYQKLKEVNAWHTKCVFRVDI